MRWTARYAVAALCALALSTLVLPAGAASLDASGWWWRAQTGLGGIGVPTPPDVPEGGLLVESTPEGATAIAALRFTLTSDEVQPILKLEVAEAANAGQAVIAACPAGAKWQPADGGSWESKPPHACVEGSVSGVPSDDGSAWTFPVAALVPLFVEGVVDVVLVPGTTESGANPSFRVAFEPPSGKSLETSSDAPEPSVPPPAAFATPGPTEAPEPTSEGAVGGTRSTPQPPSEPVFDPATEAGDEGVTSSAPLRNAPTGAEERYPGRWPAVAVLLLGAAATYWLWGQPFPAPKRLGPLAARHDAAETSPEEGPTEVRGIGRFRRPRTGEAPTL